MNIVKPDIVFFGENLPTHFHEQMSDDKDVVDLLIVMGSSMKVRPVALIPDSIPAHVPQIFINNEPLTHLTADVELIGDLDHIVAELCHRLGGDYAALTQRSTSMKQMTMDELIAKSRETGEEAGGDVEPGAKKMRLGADAGDPSSAPGAGKLTDLIPDDGYVFIPPNRSVFFGKQPPLVPPFAFQVPV